jgi:hypothetical protein
MGGCRLIRPGCWPELPPASGSQPDTPSSGPDGSTPTLARLIRRQTTEAEVRLRTGEDTERWDEERLLDTWERPLRLLAWAMVTLAGGLLIGRL